MKISAKDREMAAIICSLMACAWAGGAMMFMTPMSDVAEMLDASNAATSLAVDARLSLFNHISHAGYGGKWAEAEAMIRTGWTP